LKGFHIMKRNLALSILTGCLLYVPVCFAQDHGEVGVFADYFRLQATQRDLLGAGGRAAWNIHHGEMVAKHSVALEAEITYDFERGFGEPFTRGIATSVVSSNVRALHGLFGPKLQFGGSFRPFVTLKGGFLNIGFSNASPATGFTSALADLRNNNNRNGVLYPGGGVEWFWGPIGLRLDAGDEIFFNNGAHHNAKVTFGPHVRF
jgi:hypothetical protein